jgi:hypothetical protein
MCAARLRHKSVRLWPLGPVGRDECAHLIGSNLLPSQLRSLGAESSPAELAITCCRSGARVLATLVAFCLIQVVIAGVLGAARDVARLPCPVAMLVFAT